MTLREGGLLIVPTKETIEGCHSHFRYQEKGVLGLRTGLKRWVCV